MAPTIICVNRNHSESHWGVNFEWSVKENISSIHRSKAPTSLIGAAKTTCWAPLFSIETLAISNIQLIVVFCLAVTLCENGGIPEVMVRSKDTFVPLAIPHPIFEANHMEVSKVQLESWHVVMAKLHDLPHD